MLVKCIFQFYPISGTSGVGEKQKNEGMPFTVPIVHYSRERSALCQSGYRQREEQRQNENNVQFTKQVNK